MGASLDSESPRIPDSSPAGYPENGYLRHISRGGIPIMRRLFIIGVGAGNPDYITVQAINALKQVDVVFLIDKGEEKEDLLRLRNTLCERYLQAGTYRIAHIAEVERDAGAPCYEAAVREWHEQRAIAYETAIGRELAEDECGAFLVWGDPSLYDSTLRILARIAARGAVAFEYDVIPGITSIQALAARHRIPLNRIGEPIHITTGRRIAARPAEDIDNVVVMLDGESAFKNIADGDIDIYWGAYLGTEDEILISGNLQERMAEIERLRSEARARKGWIMDTYLLRRR
jgi:precorrin-6A synthase